MSTGKTSRPPTRFEHNDSTTGSVDALWACWTDVSTWSDWAAWVVSASMDGPFRPGSQGMLVERYGRRTTFTITALDPYVSHEFKVHIPGADVHMRREILEASHPTTFKHSVWLVGPLSGVWKRPLGARSRDELPQTMRRLANYTASVRR